MNKHWGLRGQIIDSRYRVDSFVGSGGMAAVWSATQLRTGQRVAIKVMLALESCNQVQVRRLLREAQATSAIQSRHVVRIVDVHPDYRHDGVLLPFVVMEYLEGINLAQFLHSGGALAPRNVLWLLAQISQGLSRAHAKGIVHRDLKPANVFIAEEDEQSCVVKLCDFGIAKIKRDILPDRSLDDSQLTETGELLGTPRYMAPEQLRHTGKQGTATDQWAFALVTYAAFTGRSYFDSARNGVELVLAISQDELTRPSERHAEFPAELDDWFLRSCARDPELRFESVEAQHCALRRALCHVVPEPIAIESLRLAVRGCVVAPTFSRLGRKSTELQPKEQHAAPAYERNSRFAWFLGLSTTITAAGLYLLAQQSWPSAPASVVRPRASAAMDTNANVRLVADDLQAAATPLPSRTGVATPHHDVQLPSTVVSVNGAPKPRTREYTRAPAITPNLQPVGAPCSRSAQCKSQLCLAERCQ